MDDSDNKIDRWSIRVKKFGIAVMIGICSIEKVSNNRFSEWKSETGHGHYCLVSNGSVLSNL
jgi:hypothetical protein